MTNNDINISIFDVDGNISTMNKTTIPYAIKGIDGQLARALTYPMESIKLKKNPNNIFYYNYAEDKKNNEYHFRNCFDQSEGDFGRGDFAKDLLESDKLPEYDNLIFSIEDANPILILTARGHRRNSLKKGVFDIIETTSGLKNKCASSIKEKYNFIGNNDAVINQFLDEKCMFVAVYSTEFGDKFNPNQGTGIRKKIIVKEFIDKFIQDYNVLCRISDDEKHNLDEFRILVDELSKNEKYKNLKIELIDTGNNVLSF